MCMAAYSPQKIIPEVSMLNYIRNALVPNVLEKIFPAETHQIMTVLSTLADARMLSNGLQAT